MQIITRISYYHTNSPLSRLITHQIIKFQDKNLNLNRDSDSDRFRLKFFSWNFIILIYKGTNYKFFFHLIILFLYLISIILWRNNRGLHNHISEGWAERSLKPAKHEMWSVHCSPAVGFLDRYYLRKSIASEFVGT
jgi:hypothetical protein